MILDGKKQNNEIALKIKQEIIERVNKGFRKPKLVVIQFGDFKESNSYIKHKKIFCNKVDILFEHIKFNEDISYNEAELKIKNLNNDQNVDGIIVQLPIIGNLDEEKITNLITDDKDVDGFSYNNLGKLMKNNINLPPATPSGILKLLKAYNISLVGKNVTIIGRSNIVGKPLANMLINESATVTICNSKTKNIKSFTKKSDIVVVAAGKPKLLKKDMVKKGAVVIDVGTNFIGKKLVGDVDYINVHKKASFITPVPGGVGPMTIASLCENIMSSYKKNIK